MLSVLCLTACTPDPGSGSDRRIPAPAPHRSSGASAEKGLTARARAALAAATGTGASTVASGTERVPDGVHTQPGLSEGVAYELAVVCAGEGTAGIAFGPAAQGAKSVPCDGSVVFDRFTAERSLRLDVRGNAGSAGVIAWRIDRLRPSAA